MDEEEVMMANEIFNNVLEAEEDNEHPPRRFFNRENAFDLSDDHFIKLFRLNKESTRHVIDIASTYIDEPFRRSGNDIQLKVLIALHFYAYGTYQTGVGRTIFTAVSQASVSRAIEEVTNALNNVMDDYVKFPQNINQLRELKLGFFRKYEFPGVIGCIDGTHVAIVRPIENENIYVNRKHYHSLNVQLVCDSNLKILHVNARFPGSSHDAHIWRQSNISTLMERIYRNINEPFFLLGDSGYPLRPWLLTPFEDPPPDTPEGRCNNSLKSIRCLVERCNSKLKNRFRCLIKDRVLHYKPDVATKIINACVVLHNICTDFNLPDPEDDLDIDQMGIIDDHIGPRMNQVNEDLAAGRRLRQQIAENHFR